MADIDRIKNNIRKMIDQNAPESDIDAYVASEGVTLEQLKKQPMEQPRQQARPELPGMGAVNEVSRRGAEIGKNLIRAMLPERVSEEIIGAAEMAEERVSGRKAEVEATKEAYRQGKIGSVQAATQFIGKGVAGPVMDIMGEATMIPVRGVTKATPEPVKKAVSESAAGLWNSFSQTDIGKSGIQALNTGVKEYTDWATENPQGAKTLESLVNIGLVVAPTAKKTIRSHAAKMERRSIRQTIKTKRDLVTDLIRPKETAKVAREQFARAKDVGLMKRQVIKPSPEEISMIKSTMQVKGLSKWKTLATNRRLVAAQEHRIRRSLEKQLKAAPVRLTPRQVLDDMLPKIDDHIVKNPYIRSDAANQRFAQEIKRNVERIINENPNTALGVLKARRDFDKWVKSFSPKALDPGDRETITSNMARIIRRSMNDTLDSAIPEGAVKRAFKQQSNLIKVMDNIDTRAPDQWGNVLTRAFQRVTKIARVRNQAVQTAGTLAGLGAFTATTYFAGPVAAAIAAPAVVYVGGKFITGPAVKRGLAQTLRIVDKAILTSKNPSLVRQLRADRALLADMMKNIELQKEEPDGNQVQQ